MWSIDIDILTILPTTICWVLTWTLIIKERSLTVRPLNHNVTQSLVTNLIRIIFSFPSPLYCKLYNAYDRHRFRFLLLVPLLSHHYFEDGVTGVTGVTHGGCDACQ